MSKSILLSEVAVYSEDRISGSEISTDSFVTTDSMVSNKGGITSTNLLPKGNLIAFRYGDILIGNIRPYLKKIWFANRNGGCSPDVLVIRVKPNTDSKFIYYSLLRDDFFIHMMKGSKGTKMPRGDKRQTLSFKIPLINFSEQQKIASVLSALDAKIELNNRINAELEAMAKTLYDYWFVQFDFPDADGRPYKSSGGRMVWNEGLKREVPEGWEVKPLSYHLNCNMNTIKYTDHYRTIHYLDTSSLNKNIISHLQSLDCNVDIIPSRAQRVVVNNDILFSTVRPNLRHYGIIKKPSKNLIASTGFAILSHKDDSAYNDFFFMFITSEPNLKKLDAIASSSVSSYPSINYSDILNLQIPLPRESNFLKDLSEKISAPLNIVSFKQSENQTLTELRDWLLPMLMNGQVKVVR